MTKISFWVISGVAAAVVLLTFGAYWCKFHLEGLSNDQETWGQFGDYIGGVSNPILSFITLLLTGYIAFRVSKFERERAKEERKRHLFDLQFSQYKNALDLLQNVPSVATLNRSEAARVLYMTQMGIISFVSSNHFLFKSLYDQGNFCQDLISIIGKLRNVYEESTQEYVPLADLSELISSFSQASTDFNVQMQTFLRLQLKKKKAKKN